jgi:hypothetical protein
LYVSYGAPQAGAPYAGYVTTPIKNTYNAYQISSAINDAVRITDLSNSARYIEIGSGIRAGYAAGEGTGASIAANQTPIPANSANAGVGLRNDLSSQAGVPTSTSDVWGASLIDK